MFEIPLMRGILNGTKLSLLRFLNVSEFSCSTNWIDKHILFSNCEAFKTSNNHVES